MSDMIPIKVADLAVAACNKQIEELQAENARLKAEVDAWKDMVADSGVACNERARENQDLENQIERLKAEVERLRNGVETMTWNASGVVTTQWVRAVEYDRLKAEVERLQSIHSIDSIGIEQLKAEVDRLKAENEAVKLGNKEWRQMAIERGEMNAEDAGAIGLLKAEVERLTERNQFLEQIDSYLQDGINIANEERCIQLEAQVERLTKAGDMCDQLLACFEMEGRRGVNIGRDMWREAKEGKQP
jgi:chromosome segregation ATPase